MTALAYEAGALSSMLRSFGGMPVVHSEVLAWRSLTVISLHRLGDTLVVGSAPRFPQPEVERTRRLAVLESRRIVRAALGEPDTVLDELWDSTC